MQGDVITADTSVKSEAASCWARASHHTPFQQQTPGPAANNLSGWQDRNFTSAAEWPSLTVAVETNSCCNVGVLGSLSSGHMTEAILVCWYWGESLWEVISMFSTIPPCENTEYTVNKRETLCFQLLVFRTVRNECLLFARYSVYGVLL